MMDSDTGSETEWEPVKADEVDEYEGEASPQLVCFLDTFQATTLRELLAHCKDAYDFDLEEFVRSRAPDGPAPFYQCCALVNYLADLKAHGQLSHEAAVRGILAGIDAKAAFWSDERWLMPREENAAVVSALVRLDLSVDDWENAEAQMKAEGGTGQVVVGQPLPSREYLAAQAAMLKTELEQMVAEGREEVLS